MRRGNIRENRRWLAILLPCPLQMRLAVTFCPWGEGDGVMVVALELGLGCGESLRLIEASLTVSLYLDD